MNHRFRPSACRSCKRRIVWTTTSQGRKMPVDADPVADGNIIVTEGGQSPQASVYPPGSTVEIPDAVHLRTVSHFATCPHADQHRGTTR